MRSDFYLKNIFIYFGCSDGMEREACVCDHGYERSDLCAEIIIVSVWLMCYPHHSSGRSGLN